MSKTTKVVHENGAWGGFYFLTMVGAAVYWVQASTGFGEFLVALLKAMVWPAFMMYEVLGLLRM